MQTQESKTDRVLEFVAAERRHNINKHDLARAAWPAFDLPARLAGITSARVIPLILFSSGLGFVCASTRLGHLCLLVGNLMHTFKQVTTRNVFQRFVSRSNIKYLHRDLQLIPKTYSSTWSVPFLALWKHLYGLRSTTVSPCTAFTTHPVSRSITTSQSKQCMFPQLSLSTARS
jgi:hypothetical protein